MKRLLCFALLLMLSAPAFGQAANIPTCNGTNGPNCTDYFGVANWANSPLPAGSIAGFTVMLGGSGYTAPTVTITDPTGTLATVASVAVDPVSGAITGITVGNGGSGYIAPVVTITDPSPTAGGAMVSATIGPPFTGGMPKFQDTLPSFSALPTLAGGLVAATPDTTTFPNSDFYVIGLTQYTQQLHSSLPPTTLRGYCQLANASSVTCSAGPSYLGPVIVAQKGRPVRVLFKNMLPASTSGGNLFIPVDTTYMGADKAAAGSTNTQNRATLHLHGGNTPWISDGTTMQWTAPEAEASIATSTQRGESVQFVPDMWFDGSGALITSCAGQPICGVGGATNNPGPGHLTFFWTNQQGGRLMFYHDHAYGITRLNVYAGEAAGYLLLDPAEEDKLAAATVPGTMGATTPADLTHLIPLVIQDKTFVPNSAQLAAEDPTWIGNFGSGSTALALNGSNGDLWFPHVYMPNQNPADPNGGNAFGRWDYGAWFFPPMTTLSAAGTGPLGPNTAVTIPCTSAAFPGVTLSPAAVNNYLEGCPITPNPSGTPEGFMDTPLVNGKAYPVMHVAPAAYRFQILSAGNDRSWNLQLYVADATQNNTEVAMVPAAPPAAGATLPLCSQINPITNTSLGIGLARAILDAAGTPINGTGLPLNCWPNYGSIAGIPAKQTMWAADGRAGGAPDPRTAGPPFIQIGTEGGLLPAPVVIPSTPTGYEWNPRSITITNVGVHGLWLGPAERADVIVDFTQFAGKTLILYSDAPTPAPAFDSRNDYFTGDGDQTSIGGAPNTPPGYGPNTRTVMQIVVDGSAANTVPFSLSALRAAFNSTATTPGLFASTQPTTIVPEAAYGPAYNTTFPNTFAKISDNTITFTPIAPLTFEALLGGPGTGTCTATPPAQCAVMDQKAIQELFTLDYGRMNATLGTELPFTNFLTQTTIPLGYVDPATEIIRDGDTQIWKISHNGVDTHFIHFHLVNVQVLNRVGWDGSLRPIEENELGWKDTVRMNPLEDIFVAMQATKQNLPWPIPNSVRLMDVTTTAGSAGQQFTNVDPFTNLGAPTTNAMQNFGWEYVWHCHILGHEENDMMRPIVFQVPPPAPSNLVATADLTNPGQVILTWTDNSASETGFTVERNTDAAFGPGTAFTFNAGPSTPTNDAQEGTSWGGTITAHDTPTGSTTGTYYYRVQSVDDGFKASTGLAQSYNATSALFSGWSNTVAVGAAPNASVSPTSLTFVGQLVHTTSAAQTVTLSNAPGAGTLAITSITITGVNPGDFAVSSNTCTASLVGGASCAFNVTFTPTAAGARTASVTINSSNSPSLAVPLSGTGTAPVATVSTAVVNFGNVIVNVASAPRTVMLSNTGNAPLTINSIGLLGGNAGDFAISYPCVSPLAGGNTCIISLTFKPTAMGTRSTVLVISSSDPVNPTLNVSLTGFGQQSILVVSAASLTFPLQLVNTVSAAQTVTLSNTGNIPMTINSIGLAGTTANDFVLTNPCGASLAAGGNCAISVQFRPAASGARLAAVNISTTANVNPAPTVGLTGTGTSVNLSTTTLTFPPQLVGTTSANLFVTLTNVGPTRLAINSITYSSSPFHDNTTCPIGGTLAIGGSCRIGVRFTPALAGAATATVTINAGDLGMPNAIVALNGLGIAPTLSLSTTSLGYGNLTVGLTSTYQPVTLSNTGTAPLIINSIVLNGGNANQFTQNNNCPGTLAIGASCTVNVAFRPRSRGAKSASLTVRVAAPATNQSVSLTGTGI